MFGKLDSYKGKKNPICVHVGYLCAPLLPFVGIVKGCPIHIKELDHDQPLMIPSSLPSHGRFLTHILHCSKYRLIYIILEDLPQRFENPILSSYP